MYASLSDDLKPFNKEVFLNLPLAILTIGLLWVF
jgi:hypothetical protein